MSEEIKNINLDEVEIQSEDEEIKEPTKNELFYYADYLGFDLENFPELSLEIAYQALKTPLPINFRRAYLKGSDEEVYLNLEDGRIIADNPIDIMAVQTYKKEIEDYIKREKKKAKKGNKNFKSKDEKKKKQKNKVFESGSSDDELKNKSIEKTESNESLNEDYIYSKNQKNQITNNDDEISYNESIMNKKSGNAIDDKSMRIDDKSMKIIESDEEEEREKNKRKKNKINTEKSQSVDEDVKNKEISPNKILIYSNTGDSKNNSMDQTADKKKKRGGDEVFSPSTKTSDKFDVIKEVEKYKKNIIAVDQTQSPNNNEILEEDDEYGTFDQLNSEERYSYNKKAGSVVDTDKIINISSCGENNNTTPYSSNKYKINEDIKNESYNKTHDKFKELYSDKNNKSKEKQMIKEYLKLKNKDMNAYYLNLKEDKIIIENEYSKKNLRMLDETRDKINDYERNIKLDFYNKQEEIKLKKEKEFNNIIERFKVKSQVYNSDQNEAEEKEIKIKIDNLDKNIEELIKEKKALKEEIDLNNRIEMTTKNRKHEKISEDISTAKSILQEKLEIEKKNCESKFKKLYLELELEEESKFKREMEEVRKEEIFNIEKKDLQIKASQNRILDEYKKVIQEEYDIESSKQMKKMEEDYDIKLKEIKIKYSSDLKDKDLIYKSSEHDLETHYFDQLAVIREELRIKNHEINKIVSDKLKITLQLFEDKKFSLTNEFEELLQKIVVSLHNNCSKSQNKHFFDNLNYGTNYEFTSFEEFVLKQNEIRSLEFNVKKNNVKNLDSESTKLLTQFNYLLDVTKEILSYFNDKNIIKDLVESIGASRYNLNINNSVMRDEDLLTKDEYNLNKDSKKNQFEKDIKDIAKKVASSNKNQASRLLLSYDNTNYNNKGNSINFNDKDLNTCQLNLFSFTLFKEFVKDLFIRKNLYSDSMIFTELKSMNISTCNYNNLNSSNIGSKRYNNFDSMNFNQNNIEVNSIENKNLMNINSPQKNDSYTLKKNENENKPDENLDIKEVNKQEFDNQTNSFKNHSNNNNIKIASSRLNKLKDRYVEESQNVRESSPITKSANNFNTNQFKVENNTYDTMKYINKKVDSLPSTREIISNNSIKNDEDLLDHGQLIQRNNLIEFINTAEYQLNFWKQTLEIKTTKHEQMKSNLFNSSMQYDMFSKYSTVRPSSILSNSTTIYDCIQEDQMVLNRNFNDFERCSLMYQELYHNFIVVFNNTRNLIEILKENRLNLEIRKLEVMKRDLENFLIEFSPSHTSFNKEKLKYGYDLQEENIKDRKVDEIFQHSRGYDDYIRSNTYNSDRLLKENELLKSKREYGPAYESSFYNIYADRINNKNKSSSTIENFYQSKPTYFHKDSFLNSNRSSNNIKVANNDLYSSRYFKSHKDLDNYSSNIMKNNFAIEEIKRKLNMK